MAPAAVLDEVGPDPTIWHWCLIPTPRLGRERVPANGSLLSGRFL
jgi:hypothetical protein